MLSKDFKTKIILLNLNSLRKLYLKILASNHILKKKVEHISLKLTKYIVYLKYQ